MALILQYCLRDVTDEDAGESLHGLSLVPLADGYVGIIMKGPMSSKIIVASQEERQLLEVGVRHMMVNSDIDEAVYNRLFGIAGHGRTNLQRVSAGLVAELMSWLVPGEWKERDVVEWRPRERHEREREFSTVNGERRDFEQRGTPKHRLVGAPEEISQFALSDGKGFRNIQ